MFTDSEEQIIMFCEQLDIQLSCTDILNFKSIWSGKLNVKSVWSGKLNVYERPNPPGLAGTHNHELGSGGAGVWRTVQFLSSEALQHSREAQQC